MNELRLPRFSVTKVESNGIVNHAPGPDLATRITLSGDDTNTILLLYWLRRISPNSERAEGEKTMTADEKVNTYSTTARIVGALFLIAMVTSLVGGGLIDATLSATDYLGTASTSRTTVTIGALLELVNGIAVVGIAVGMFPIFRKRDEALALGYVAFRTIEAVIVVAAVISPLALVALSKEYVGANAADASQFQTAGASLMATRAVWVGSMLGLFFGLAALLLFYLLYKQKLVPRWISVWGLIGVVLVMAWNLLELFGISVSVGIILALPMILNEIFLALWLIVKGFNPSAIASISA